MIDSHDRPRPRDAQEGTFNPKTDYRSKHCCCCRAQQAGSNKQVERSRILRQNRIEMHQWAAAFSDQSATGVRQPMAWQRATSIKPFEWRFRALFSSVFDRSSQ
jgi:hypothetical protein